MPRLVSLPSMRQGSTTNRGLSSSPTFGRSLLPGSIEETYPQGHNSRGIGPFPAHPPSFHPWIDDHGDPPLYEATADRIARLLPLLVVANPSALILHISDRLLQLVDRFMSGSWTQSA